MKAPVTATAAAVAAATLATTSAVELQLLRDSAAAAAVAAEILDDFGCPLKAAEEGPDAVVVVFVVADEPLKNDAPSLDEPREEEEEAAAAGAASDAAEASYPDAPSASEGNAS